jgi:hypothetical protein
MSQCSVFPSYLARAGGWGLWLYMAAWLRELEV